MGRRTDRDRDADGAVVTRPAKRPAPVDPGSLPGERITVEIPAVSDDDLAAEWLRQQAVAS